MFIPEIRHSVLCYLFWIKSQGFGLDGFYKLNGIGRMISWISFNFLSSQSLVCWFLATSPETSLGIVKGKRMQPWEQVVTERWTLEPAGSWRSSHPMPRLTCDGALNKTLSNWMPRFKPPIGLIKIEKRRNLRILQNCREIASHALMVGK